MLITRKLGEMIGDADMRSTIIYSKRKALTALFPYVVLRVKEGKHEMFNVFLRVVRSSEWSGFMWFYIEPLLSALLEETRIFLKRAAILVSPHLPWWKFRNGGQLVQLWAEAVFEMVRALKNIETLTSYLLLVWSEWDCLMPGSLDEMYTVIREDFSGEEVGHHRKDLLCRLGHVRRELEPGLGHIRQYKPWLTEDNLRLKRDQYRRLEEILLEVDKEAIDRPICESLDC